MLSLENQKKKETMVRILQSNNWSSQDSLTNAAKLNSERRNDLCTIVFDGFQKQPEVFEVFVNVFKDEKKTFLSDENMTKLVEVFSNLDFDIDFSDFINEEELARLEKAFEKTRPSELMY